MILFCSVVFWVGLFGLFLGGFEFIGLSDELVPRDLRVPVQHVLPVDFDHALLLDGDHHLHGAFPFARRGLLAEHAGHDRPDLRLQVRRGGRDLELGLFSAGQPAHGGLRDHGRRLRRPFMRCS